MTDFLFNAEGFTELRIVFVVMLAILILFFILSLLPKGRDSHVNFFSVLMISLTHIGIGATLMVVENQLLVEHNWEGDGLTLIFFIAVVVLGILNPIIFKLRNRKNRRSRGGYSFR